MLRRRSQEAIGAGNDRGGNARGADAAAAAPARFQVQLCNQWHDFGLEEDMALREAWEAGQALVVLCSRGQVYEYDFVLLEQTNTGTGRRRCIRLPLGWRTNTDPSACGAPCADGHQANAGRIAPVAEPGTLLGHRFGLKGYGSGSTEGDELLAEADNHDHIAHYGIGVASEFIADLF